MLKIKPKSEVQHRTESPILAAEKKLLRSTERVVGYPYVPDGFKRRSTYAQDFGVKGRRSKAGGSKQDKSPIRKPKPVVGGTKSGNFIFRKCFFFTTSRHFIYFIFRF
jgi:hypothetical protein